MKTIIGCLKPLFFSSCLLALFLIIFEPMTVSAQTTKPLSTPKIGRLTTPTPSPIPTLEALATPKADITQKTEAVIGPLEQALEKQVLGPVWPKNPLKYATRAAIKSGIPANTIVLLLLIPAVAAIIASSRHLIGLRGFGIFLPAALSVVFVAIGPILGIILFLVIIIVSSLIRLLLRRMKIKLQYLPRMSLILLFAVFGVLGILFLAPVINKPDLSNVSIFPVLILVLLAEDFTRVQLGKSMKIAVNLTIETLILALVSYLFLTTKAIQEYALLNPEITLIVVLIVDLAMGKYVGLRFLEYWRFRKLIKS